MADTTAEPGSGDVPLLLCGETLVLRPSLEACRAIAKLANESLTQAIVRVVERLDFDFVVEVVALGCGATSPSLKKQVAAKVYQQGVISVAADVALYIRTIMNGGSRPKDDPVIHSINLLDRLETDLPDEFREHTPALDALREALVERIKAGEGDSEAADPLAASGSPSGSSTA